MAIAHYDVLVLGAGAAGMMAAIEAGKRGRRVLVVERGKAPGEKIRISGGGRCNFTNRFATTREGLGQFISSNPRFMVSALARYTPERFIGLIEGYGIAWHEKTLGQLFCDGSATQVVAMLTTEMQKAGVTLKLETELTAIERPPTGFRPRSPMVRSLPPRSSLRPAGNRSRRWARPTAATILPPGSASTCWRRAPRWCP
jgi:predicted flavoprotein YhiN